MALFICVFNSEASEITILAHAFKGNFLHLEVEKINNLKLVSNLPSHQSGPQHTDDEELNRS